MADPTIQTFCCHHRANADSAVKLMAEFNTESYIIVCLVSSLIGISGSIYQIFVRKEPIESKNLGRKIIVCLAYADLLASLGIFVRSALWRFVKKVMPDTDLDSVIFCSISSAWVQFFYTSTWLWTLCYAVNMRRSLLKQPVREIHYHMIVWSAAAVLTSIGTTTLYYPNADCHDIHSISTAFFRVMPNYLMNYGPILVVFIVNPILYYKCSKEVDRQLISSGQFTNKERAILDVFRLKFSLIILIFYVCWMPNVANAVLLWTMWFKLPVKLVIFTWYMMAITNPLQALLNVFVYRQWNNNWSIKDLPIVRFWRPKVHEVTTSNISITENSPLLSQPATSASSIFYSTESIVNQLEDDEFHRHSVNSCKVV